MSEYAVQVNNLGKMYRIGNALQSGQTFREAFSQTLTAPFHRMLDILQGQAYGAAGLKKEIWALKDITFDVKHGEVVGIIGRNGAGKSTLLKVLSRITEPTAGYADIYGRVGALLEVGTGFHSELTGRENVYLNGAILGMTKRDIDRKFDEIVHFSGVEKFIDTPVKHYSSGMGLRLGFSVAAHLEPEILIIDEVLAVGDAEFQKRCVGKMSDVASEGRTVLFVSHNMSAVKELCSRAILLELGEVIYANDVNSVINFYLRETAGAKPQDSLLDRRDRRGNGPLRFSKIKLKSSSGFVVENVLAGDPVQFEIEYQAENEVPLKDVHISLRVFNNFDQCLFTASTQFTNESFDSLPPQGKVVVDIDTIPLLVGDYTVQLWSSVDDIVSDSIYNCLRFGVIESNVFNTAHFPDNEKHGVFFVNHSWKAAEYASSE